jgi:hypothetical protein
MDAGFIGAKVDAGRETVSAASVDGGPFVVAEFVEHDFEALVSEA